eukprot:CAMPEP_0116558646 /NCGR_PEP_ID=MMETSP0397-20121206/9926_1 /TAXON_ID=216820 /ORGANISM="Cyclophora tenuis, Strain ECT3854" /LENGTH=44 /DNA_ID= /DNA_START= /DNA_END= /DNA_ORIENTATION=
MQVTRVVATAKPEKLAKAEKPAKATKSDQTMALANHQIVSILVS